MNWQNKDEIVQKYLEGDLSSAQRTEFRDMLKVDDELKELFEFYSLLQLDLKEMQEVEMPEDLWARKIKPALKEHLPKENNFWVRMADFFKGFIPKAWKPAVGALAFVAVMVVVTVFMQSQLIDEADDVYSQSFKRIQEIRGEYKRELASLFENVKGRYDTMMPEIREKYSQTLAMIDEAIEDAERYYSLYSDEPEAIEMLMAAYDRKADFLRSILKFSASMESSYEQN